MAPLNPVNVAAASAAFGWGNTLACVATFNVLEHDDKMDQFEDKDTPFDQAGSLTMGKLRYWPGGSLPPGGLETVALLKAQEFRNGVVKNFTGAKQDLSLGKATVIRALAKVFGKKSGTLTDLAAIIATSFTFPDPS